MPRAVRAGFVQHQARIVVDENVGIRGIEVRTMQDTTPARAVRCIAICGTLGVAVKRVLAMAGLGLHRRRMAAFRLRGRDTAVFGFGRLGTPCRLRMAVF